LIISEDNGRWFPRRTMQKEEKKMKETFISLFVYFISTVKMRKSKEGMN